MVRTVAVCVFVGAALAVAGAPASAVPGSGGCPRGFEIGLLTLDQGADLLIDLGVPATRDEVLARLSGVDRNADKSLCFRDLPDTAGIAEFTFNYVDNRAR